MTKRFPSSVEGRNSLITKENLSQMETILTIRQTNSLMLAQNNPARAISDGFLFNGKLALSSPR